MSKKKPDQVADNPSTLPYASNVGAPSIKPSNLTSFKQEKLLKTNKNGIPDLLALHSSYGIEFYEIKDKKGKLSKLQEFRINELKKNGFKAEVFRG